jgi:FkbM family methyltransferase
VRKFLRTQRTGIIADSCFDLIIDRESEIASIESELVQCDVGDLEFPSFDLVMRPLIIAHKSWEKEEADFLRKIVNSGNLIINVGANVGYTTLLLAQLVGKRGSVVAVEPEIGNSELLRRNLRRAKNKNVVQIRAACGDRTGLIDLHLSDHNAGDHRTTRNLASTECQTVPCYRLDDLVRHPQRIHGLVCDAQGFDHRIIAGAKSALSGRCSFVMTEFWPHGIEEAGDDPETIFRVYQNQFYAVVDVPTQMDLTRASWEQAAKTICASKDHSTLLLLTSPRSW